MNAAARVGEVLDDRYRLDQLIGRGAMADVNGGGKPTVKHRFYHVPASNTAVGHVIMEDPA